MRFTLSFLAVVVGVIPILVSAAPLRRNTAASNVLKFADVLEQLENQFYKDALAKFKDADFVAAGFPSSEVPIEQFKVIQEDEATHSSVLQSVLKSVGEQPITSCKFNFDPVLTDVTTMAAVARVVELVGVGAYLGAAPSVGDPSLLVIAGSILTVEARHQTILNILSNGGSSIPSAFDIGLLPNEVLALASPFIDGPCNVSFTANPTLTVTTNSSLTPGTKLTFSSPALNSTNEETAFCQMLVGGKDISLPLPLKDCTVPEGINGPVLIWVTSDGQPLVKDSAKRDTKGVIAGPTIGFVDTKPQLLGQLARLNAANPSLTTISTTTLSPSEVNSLLPTSTTQSSPSSSASGGSLLEAAIPSSTESGPSPTATSGGSKPAVINLLAG